MTKRLIIPYCLFAEQKELSVKDRKLKQRLLNEFTGQLFREAMHFPGANMADALSAVYLSGLYHALELGPRIES
jgi:hypothetical protein